MVLTAEVGFRPKEPLYVPSSPTSGFSRMVELPNNYTLPVSASGCQAMQRDGTGSAVDSKLFDDPVLLHLVGELSWREAQAGGSPRLGGARFV